VKEKRVLHTARHWDFGRIAAKTMRLRWTRVMLWTLTNPGRSQCSGDKTLNLCWRMGALKLGT